MDVDHLREFVSLAKTLSFTRTARENSVAQSTLSRHIDAIEREVGARLFARTTSQVRLTEEGKAFYEGVAPALESIDAAAVKARVIRDGHETKVVVGGCLLISDVTERLYGIETMIRASGAATTLSLYPPHTIDFMQESARDDALDLLADHVIDVAVLEGPERFPRLAEFCSMRLFDLPMVFFGVSGGSLADRERVTIRDLAGHPFVGSINYPDFQDRIREICAERGFTPAINVRLADTFNSFMRPQDPEEVFFLSKSGADRVPDPPLSPLVKLPIDDPIAYSPVYVAWNRADEKKLAQFLDAAARLAGETRTR